MKKYLDKSFNYMDELMYFLNQNTEIKTLGFTSKGKFGGEGYILVYKNPEWKENEKENSKG